MRLAEIEEGIVVNVIVVSPDQIPEWCEGWPEAIEAGPGWTFDGAVFAPPEDHPEA